MADRPKQKDRQEQGTSRIPLTNPKASEVFSAPLKICIPLLVVLNLVGWVYGHLTNAIQVHFAGYYPLEALPQRALYNDSFIDEIGFLKSANDWITLVLLVAMSGVWPYIHLVILLVVVVLMSYKHISRDRSRAILNVLGEVGSWTPAFLFVLCFNVVFLDIFTKEVEVPIHMTDITHAAMGGMGHMRIALWTYVTHTAIVMFIACVLMMLLTSWVRSEVAPVQNAEEFPEVSYGTNSHRRPTAGWKSKKPSIILAACAFILLLVASGMDFMHMEMGGFLGKMMHEDDQKLELSLFKMVDKLASMDRYRCEEVKIFNQRAKLRSIGNSKQREPTDWDPLGDRRFGKIENTVAMKAMSESTPVSRWPDDERRTCKGGPSMSGFLAFLLVSYTFIAPLLELIFLLGSLLIGNRGVNRHIWSQRCLKIATWLYGFNSLDSFLVIAVFRFGDTESFDLNSSCDLFSSYVDPTIMADNADWCLVRNEHLTTGWWLLFAHVACRHLSWKWLVA
mmetsp:Transcript_23467/g.49953  ORF Transcript_23467/g.49953 Transcript_23467/m.49953 type:complete len:507 (+) Transcript_23467:95-1615(+)